MTHHHTQTFQPRLAKKPPFSVEVAGVKPVEGETIPRRNPVAAEKLRSSLDDGAVTTIYEILKRSSEKFGNAKAMGSRDIIQTHTEKKTIKKKVNGQEQEVEKAWTFFELGPFKYKSFVEFERLALQLGAGLRKLGLVAEDRVEIFAGTSVYWIAMAHASASQSMPIVTAYDTLGEEGLKHSLVQTRAKAIYLDPHLLKTLTKPLKEAKELKYIIYNSSGSTKQTDIDAFKTVHPDVTVISTEDLRALGESNPVDPVPPKPQDLCCIMYTSGSTGTPKGVPLKHKNVVAAIAGVDAIIGHYLSPADSMLTYLPLAHILEFVFENSNLYWGSVMGYGNPKTLSDSSVRNCNGDIRELKPTILVGVPAVWESVKKGIEAKVNSGSPIVKNLFWGAMSAKEFLMWSGLPGAGILDAVVFKKVKEATGGRLRICLNGGGPIAKDTQKFISMAITPMISGYGLTETSAMGAIMDPLEWSADTLGDIPASIEIKLVDYADAGYFAKSNPPQGEIWIRGESVMEGYYQNDKETSETMTSDGWFKTGDVGEWDKTGHLKIIDRKKNLVKTVNGEYIALEKLESLYRAATVVQNICVYAALDKAKPIAIIVPAEPALKKLAAAHGVAGNSIEELVHDAKLQGVVLEELQKAGKKGGLIGFEIIDGVVMADEEWNPQNGLTTAAQKINRRGILEKYKKEVDEAYAKSG